MRLAGIAQKFASPPSLGIVIALFALALIPYVLRIPDETVGIRDEVKHLLTTRALVEGRDQNLPVRSQYPPGWPLLLAGVFTLTGWNLAVGHGLCSLLAWVTGLLAFLYLRRRMAPWLALIVGLMISMHGQVLRISEMLLCTPAFTVALWGTLLLADEPQGSARHGRRILTGGATALAMAFRSVGITLWGGLVLYALARRDGAGEDPFGVRLRRRLIHATSLSLLPVIYLVLLSTLTPQRSVRPDTGYGQQFFAYRVPPGHSRLIGIALRTVQDFKWHVRDMRVTMLPIEMGRSPITLIPKVMVVVLGLLAAVGWARCLAARREPAPWFLGCYLALIFVWPYFSFTFFVPALPLLYAYTALSLKRNAAVEQEPLRRYARATRAAVAMVVVFLALGAAAAFVSGLFRPAPQHTERVAFDAALRNAVETAAAGGQLIATPNVFLVRYYDRTAPLCPLSYSRNTVDHLSRMRESRAGWLLAEQFSRGNVEELIRAQARYIKPIAIRDNVYLYRVSPAMYEKP